jgi:hypothetical protein
MPLGRNKLYSIVIIACSSGYLWLTYNLTNKNSNTETHGVCLIKHFTNVPCPSCGTTRSVILLTKGQFFEALAINPFGFIVFIIMLASPFWISLDLIRKKNTFYDFYLQIENYLKRPIVKLILILLILLNWGWNIKKGL